MQYSHIVYQVGLHFQFPNGFSQKDGAAYIHTYYLTFNSLTDSHVDAKVYLTINAPFVFQFPNGFSRDVTTERIFHALSLLSIP